jgi:hypothetical protein
MEILAKFPHRECRSVIQAMNESGTTDIKPATNTLRLPCLKIKKPQELLPAASNVIFNPGFDLEKVRARWSL